MEAPTIAQLNKQPLVILPLIEWERIQDQLEDLQMSLSKTLRVKVAKARLEKKSYTPAEIRKRLRL